MNPNNPLHTIEKLLQDYKSSLNQTFRSKDFPISREQWIILECIAINPQLSQSQLAEQTFRDPAALTRSIDLLEKKGFVKRLPSNTDRRSYQLSLSVDGGRLFNRIQPEIEQIYKKAFRDVSKNEQMQLDETLHKISININN